MAKTVVGSFDSFDEAQRVVDQLRSRGIDSGDISIVANDAAGTYGSRLSGGASGTTTPAETHSTGSDVASGAATGVVVGGAAGLLAGLAGLAVPGVGPLVAAGPIAAALAGAGVGAVAGGLIGGLRHVGVDETDAEYYAEAVRRGGALVTVRADDARANEVADLMRQHGAVDIQGRVSQWKQSGWTRFDESAQPYTPDQIQRERSTYSTSTSGTVSSSTGGMSSTGGSMSGTSTANTSMSGLSTGTSTTAGATLGDDLRRAENAAARGTQRAGDAIERAIPGDSDRDGK